MFGIKLKLEGHKAVDEKTFKEAVELYYESLYRFALSLTHTEADACDLTQATFERLATRGHQVRDLSKLKAWLFTTLHRRFITWRRWKVRFPHFELSLVSTELPSVSAQIAAKLDGKAAREALQQIDELYRIPLILFYLEEHSYKEIAGILGIPNGTVMSRIARGREMLRQLLKDKKVQTLPESEPPSRFGVPVVVL